MLVSARQITPAGRRLICVFGCGGDRDRDKRPLMGSITDRLADLAVVTSDNPRNEDPEAIIDEIRAGIGGGGAQVEVEPERRAAIGLALAAAERGDTVVIAGKGHEQGQEFEGAGRSPSTTARSPASNSGRSRRPGRDRARTGSDRRLVRRRDRGPRAGRRAATGGRSDSREAAAGDLFFGLRGERADGGEHAAAALAAGAWGAVVDSDRAVSLAAEGHRGWVFAASDPLLALQRPARAVRRALGCPVVGITGSTGKTSVKDITAALLPGRVHASSENFNTEIGLPLTVCAAPADTDVLVLEMAMRGLGQIAELCEIAEPDVAAITNVGPVHLELLGTVEAIAEAKAEIVGGLARRGGPSFRPTPRRSSRTWRLRRTITFGHGGDVFASASSWDRGATAGADRHPRRRGGIRVPVRQAHNLVNATCAVAIGVALGVPVGEMARRAPGIVFSRLRGEPFDLAGGSCWSTTATTPTPSRCRRRWTISPRWRRRERIAVLGGMAELGPTRPAYHRSSAPTRAARDRADRRGGGAGSRLLARRVGPRPRRGGRSRRRAARRGDAVLVKGSRSVGLESVHRGAPRPVGEG